MDNEENVEEYWDEESRCVVCGGEGWIENDDPLWHGFDVDSIKCPSCGGSGFAKDMTFC